MKLLSLRKFYVAIIDLIVHVYVHSNMYIIAYKLNYNDSCNYTIT